MKYNEDGCIINDDVNICFERENKMNKLCSGYFCSFIIPPVNHIFKKVISNNYSRYNSGYTNTLRNLLYEIYSTHSNPDNNDVLNIGNFSNILCSKKEIINLDKPDLNKPAKGYTAKGKCYRYKNDNKELFDYYNSIYLDSYQLLTEYNHLDRLGIRKSIKKCSPGYEQNNFETLNINKGHMQTRKVNLKGQRGKSGRRETPSKIADIIKSEKIKSKKYLKPEQNQIRLENLKNPHKGVG